MLGQKVLPAILLIFPAAAALTVQPTVVGAASDECRAKPGPAVSGGRWYYRINRGDHRRCWYVSSQGVPTHLRLHRAASVGRRHITGGNSAREMLDARGDPQPDEQIGSAPTVPTEAATNKQQTTVPEFASRWLSPTISVDDLGPRKIATIAYARPTSNPRKSSTALVEAQRPVELSSAGSANFDFFFLGGVFSTGLLVASGVLYVSRRARQTHFRAVTIDEPERGQVALAPSDEPTAYTSMVQTRHLASHRQRSPPTAPVDGSETIAIDEPAGGRDRRAGSQQRLSQWNRGLCKVAKKS